MKRFIKAYLKLESLPDEVRSANGIRSKERLDATMVYLNGYEGLQPFVNAKGQIALWKRSCREGVNANVRRRAEWMLTDGKLNFSSVFTEIGLSGFGWGYPNSKPHLPSGIKNPMYPFREDAYLFITNQDFSIIEVLIIEGGRHLINHYFQHLIGGLLDDEIKGLRDGAALFYSYKEFKGIL